MHDCSSRVILTRLLSCHNFTRRANISSQRKLNQKCPSFNTKGSVNNLVSQVPLRNVLSVFFTGNTDLPYTSISKSINLADFYRGSKTAIEVVSLGISRRNQSTLQNLLTSDCQEKEQKFSFSMNDLDKCIQATHEYQDFKTNIQKEMSKKGPVLQREDFDAAKFRKLQSNFEEMNPGRLVKDNDIVITNYTFQKRGSEDWQISAVGYLNTRQNWNWFKKFKWKGRLHISIHQRMAFIRVLRYDYMFDVLWISLLFYLQLLAFLLARKITEEEEQKEKQKR